MSKASLVVVLDVASSGSLEDVTEDAGVCSEVSLIGSSVFSEGAVELGVVSEDSLGEVAEDGLLVFSDSLGIVEDFGVLSEESLGLSDSFGVVED